MVVAAANDILWGYLLISHGKEEQFWPDSTSKDGLKRTQTRDLPAYYDLDTQPIHISFGITKNVYELFWALLNCTVGSSEKSGLLSCSQFESRTIPARIATCPLGPPYYVLIRSPIISYPQIIRLIDCLLHLFRRKTEWLRFRGREKWLHSPLKHFLLPCGMK